MAYQHELDIEPVNRYLLIQDKIDFDIGKLKKNYISNWQHKIPLKEWDGLMQEFHSIEKSGTDKNLLSVGINYSYGNIVLPKTYEIIFDKKDLVRYWVQKTIVKCAFNYRDFFHTDLWIGHTAHCLIEVVGNLPDIFNELPINDGGLTVHNGIGLCTKYDWQYIVQKSPQKLN